MAGGDLKRRNLRKASSQEPLLEPAHAVGFLRSRILVTVQMQQPMDDVKGQFVVQGIPEARSVERGRLDAHHDLTMLEGDHIRGAGDIHESLVDIRDDPIRNDGNLHFRQRVQRKTAIRGMWRALLQRDPGQAAQPGQSHAKRALAIEDADFQAAETGGTVDREDGSGVSRLSERSSG